MSWSVEQVLALAPDPSSAKSGKELSAARKWKTLGANEVCAWGTIQGSGKDAYQTSIDLSGPAFRCSCPSRKVPCKHGLGLFLILAHQPSAMTEKAPPLWTTEWLSKRAEKEEKKAAKLTAPEAPPDDEAAAKALAASAKRAAARESKVTSGLEELGVWLGDLVRAGFATLPGKPSSFWQVPAARLVDAQASGLARRVAVLDGITTTGEGWPVQLLREAALLHLAREGWSRIESLPPETRADLRTTVGYTTSQEDLLAQAGLRDQWAVVGRSVEETDEGLRVQRTWLFGRQSGRPALCLSFSPGATQPLDTSLVPGSLLDAELVFFPSAWPARAVVKQRHGTAENFTPDYPHKSIAAANAFAAGAFSANPWIERVPFALAAVYPMRRTGGWIVRDEAGDCLTISLPERKAWRLLALSGGRSCAVAGEWNGQSLHPFSVWSEGRFLPL